MQSADLGDMLCWVLFQGIAEQLQPLLPFMAQPASQYAPHSTRVSIDWMYSKIWGLSLHTGYPEDSSLHECWFIWFPYVSEVKSCFGDSLWEEVREIHSCKYSLIQDTSLVGDERLILLSTKVIWYALCQKSVSCQYLFLFSCNTPTPDSDTFESCKEHTNCFPDHLWWQQQWQKPLQGGL